MTTTLDVTKAITLPFRDAVALQAVELERTIALLASLSPNEWTAQTDCPAWDVRRMYLHVLGACEAGASFKEMVHQMKVARGVQKADGGPLEAALSSVQVRERDGLTPDELVRRLRDIAPRTVRRRRSLPAPVRRAIRMKVDGPVVERWALGYLVGTIYLRDMWLHRIDASRAVGREPVLSADHDGRIVADAVGEWARRHAQPFELDLTGTAGGSFTAGSGGPVLEMDAIECCRTLGGRAPAEGLLATIVPF